MIEERDERENGTTGTLLSCMSIRVMLPIGTIGAIVMPWLIGQIADLVSLQAGMMINLVPCVGIMILSVILLKMKNKKICTK